MNPKTDRRPAEFNTVLRAQKDYPRSCGLPTTSSILTLRGQIKISDLRAGDKVITRDSGTAQLLAIDIDTATGPMVKVQSGALGDATPPTDVVIPAETELFLRDSLVHAYLGKSSALVRVTDLIDKKMIKPCTARVEMAYLTFALPHILYVDGLEISSGLTPETFQHARSA
ncbi:Hint domain-containing protein [Algirhabdus cladophorae]|uniref:Hint domain-containing protein n=1 Tax=Algirhabdus cladophorae TaxID=3377108 RepID=UPI003B846BF8